MPTSRLVRGLALLGLGALAACRVTRPTVTQLVPDPPLFMVAHPLRYETPDRQHAFVVPVGFVTDLASIPKGLWWWQSPHEGTLAPAILHDYLYWEQSCTKDEADAVMYLAMHDVGLTGVRAEAVYRGIRTPFAQSAWDGNGAARRRGETRFFTEADARSILDSDVARGATWPSLQKQAAARSGLTVPAFPNASTKATCTAALRAFQAPPSS